MRRWIGVAIGLGLCALWACGPGLSKSLSPTELGACRKVAGAYVSSYQNSCGKVSLGDDMTITQSGCTIGGDIPGVGTVTGKITDAAIDWKVSFEGGCTGSGTGTGKIDGTHLTGSYSGAQSGTGCCAIVAGTFLLVPN